MSPILPMSETWSDYLRDESKLMGSAESISFPKTEEEICEIVREMHQNSIPVTIQGGKTGITGAAVPVRGHILNLSEFHGVLDFCTDGDTYLLTVRAGTRLDEMNKEIARLNAPVRLFWPPQPTETTATVGGAIATGASGIQSFGYGDSKQYIHSLRVLTAGGTIAEMNADQLETYWGSEGMLGLILSVTLKLLPIPEEQWGIGFFFPDRQLAWQFADFIQKRDALSPTAVVTVAEYMDRRAIDLVEEHKSQMSKLDDIPMVPEDADAMIYLEISGEESGIEEAAGILMEVAAELESDPDQAWAVSGESELESMRIFRHAIPETANLVVEQNHRTSGCITKLSTDYGFANLKFSRMMNWYEEQMQDWNTRKIVFGHIGGSHVHWNFFPESEAEYQECLARLNTLGLNIRIQGGCAAQENGFGKLKKRWIPIENYRMGMMRTKKQQLDPQNFWNPENYF
ncbi:MAG: FAD-binding oxidoreductase [Eubacteriales bacterium]|nr:FAD-binding oxidoreductase [Eubacteriales bacterium]